MEVPGSFSPAFLPIDPGDGAADLGDEVVAARLVTVPPAAGDAFGTGDERQPGFCNPSGLRQQPCRPRPRLHEIVRVPVARLDTPPGVFRPMVRKRRHAVAGIAPKPRLHRLAELGPLLGLRGAVAKEAAAWRAERREISRLERDGLYRLRESKRGELLAQECGQALGVTCRRSELHRHGAPR